MTRPLLLAASLAALMIPLFAAHAEEAESSIAPAARAAFDQRVFGRPISSQKSYACFVRRYDAAHLAQHPQQKVKAMKLLVSAEKPPEDGSDAYAFRLGLKYRDSKADYDAEGYCRHVVDDDNEGALRFGCGIECDGGSIGVALAKDGGSVKISVERLRIEQRGKADDDSYHELVGGTDDKLFRLDRADLRDCASLVTDRKELAALRRQR